MRLEGFISLLACVVMLCGMAWSLRELHLHTRQSVAAVAASQPASSPP